MVSALHISTQELVSGLELPRLSLIESVCILQPILPKGRIHRRRIAGDALEVHVGAIHNVQRPQLRVLDIEILHYDIAHVPNDERHRPPWLREVLLHIVPSIPVAIDAAGAVPVDPDTLTSDNEAGMVVLESDRVRIVAPVCQVSGVLLA